jgi:hypothetical protein
VPSTLTLEQAQAASREFVPHVSAMSGGKARLTGEYPDVYVLDHLLAPHYGTASPSRELADFALSAGVYLCFMLARLWRESGLESQWHEGDLTDCGIGVKLDAGAGVRTFLLACPSDVYAFVEKPPNPFPRFAGSWVSLRPGDPLLPGYLLGGLCLSQPLARGDWEQAPPGGNGFLRGHLERVLDAVALSCARDLQPETGLPQRLLEVLYGAALWPPIGERGNDYGIENIRQFASQIAHAGSEYRPEVLSALESMERGWVSDGAYLAGLARRALLDREEAPEERMGFHIPEVRDVLEETRRIFADVMK